MTTNSEAVKKWRQQTKLRIIEAMGGKCVCCGYNKCAAAMDLHHINPTEKEFSFSSARANPQSWKKLVTELRKCVLVCNRCHQEIHAEIRSLPDTYAKFNEDYVKYKEGRLQDTCPVCGKLKPSTNITCSLECAAKRKGKVDWDKVDLEVLLENLSYAAIGRLLGISDVAVRKRAIKLGLR